MAVVVLFPPIVPLPRVSGPFGQVRGTRDDGSPKLHNGVDWPAVDGTPLHAMTSGRVAFRLSADDDDDGDVASGNAVGVVSDDGRIRWSFSHMSHIFVRTGDAVRAGDVIGEVGHTGTVRPPGPAGAHVHVTLKIDDRLADAAAFVGPSSSGGLLADVALVGAGFALAGPPGAAVGAGVALLRRMS